MQWYQISNVDNCLIFCPRSLQSSSAEPREGAAGRRVSKGIFGCTIGLTPEIGVQAAQITGAAVGHAPAW